MGKCCKTGKNEYHTKIKYISSSQEMMISILQTSDIRLSARTPIMFDAVRFSLFDQRPGTNAIVDLWLNHRIQSFERIWCCKNLKVATKLTDEDFAAPNSLGRHSDLQYHGEFRLCLSLVCRGSNKKSTSAMRKIPRNLLKCPLFLY